MKRKYKEGGDSNLSKLASLGCRFFLTGTKARVDIFLNN